MAIHKYETWTFYLDTKKDEISQPPGVIPMRCQVFMLYNTPWFITEVSVAEKEVYLRKISLKGVLENE